jgi:methionyl-tRNA synthetase
MTKNTSSAKKPSSIFLTTPIYYINDRPHIGHAYATIAADVLARYHRQHGDKVLFTTGTDENSQKTLIAAKAVDQEVGAYTDEMAQLWQDTWHKLGISFDRFIRTTEKDHIRAVKEVLKLIEKRGDIYPGTYEGLYCVGHEAFLREDELVDGKCPDHGVAPQKVKEENYFFKLSKYGDLLLRHIEANPNFVLPATRRNEVVAFIKQGLEDISISRAKQEWGIPLPQAKDQVVYVWFDALINYLTVTGYPEDDYTKWWPATLHLVGKDIIKFHCIIWPAMLLSAGLELPQTVFATGFFTVDGQKISKSLGNAIDPIVLADEFGLDALRYYLLREIPFGADGEFSHERFEQVYNSDLANELGNLVQRVSAMLLRYQGGKAGELPHFSHDVSLYHEALASYRLDKALEAVWVLIKGLNQYLEEEKPWELAKGDTEQLQAVLAHAVTDLNQVATLLMPFMPTTAEKILQTFADGQANPKVGILFPKKD